MERRQSPRYPVKLRVYFPEYRLWGCTKNLSIDGCFVSIDKKINEGFVAEILLELPLIGAISLKGYVVHSGMKDDGLGMQFVQVRFAQEESSYYSIFTDYVKLLPEHERIRAEYLKKVHKGIIKLQVMPDEGSC